MSATLARPAPSGPVPSARSPAGRAELPLVLGLTLLAGVLRFATLDVQSLWADEGFTHAIATGPLGDVWGSVRETESSPPLSYGLTWAWVQIWGDGEVGVRSLSALVSTLTVPLVYVTARILAPRRVAVIAAGLSALAPFLVWYGQEARAYALFALLGLGAFACFLLARRSSGRAPLAGWAVLSALALATHWFAAFPALVEGVWLLAAVRPRRRALLALAGPALAALLLAPLLLHQRAHVPRPWTEVYGPYDELASTVQEFALGHGWTPLMHRPGFAVAAVVAALAVALLLTRGGPGERRLARAAGIVAGATVLLPLLFSLTGPTLLAPRNVIVAWPIGILVLAAGLGARRAGRLGLGATAVLAALFLAIDVAVPLTASLRRDAWRDAAGRLGRTPEPRLVLVGDGFLHPPVVRAYLPGAARAPDGAFAVREVAVLTDRRVSPTLLTTPPAPGFSRLASGTFRRLGVARWRAPAAVAVDPAALRAAGGEALVLPGDR